MSPGRQTLNFFNNSRRFNHGAEIGVSESLAVGTGHFALSLAVGPRLSYATHDTIHAHAAMIATMGRYKFGERTWTLTIHFYIGPAAATSEA